MTNTPEWFQPQQLAQTEHFRVSGDRISGFFVETTDQTIGDVRAYLGWSCVTYTELEYLVSLLTDELRDLLGQTERSPSAGPLWRRSMRRPALIDPQRHSGLALRFYIFKRDGYRCQICGRNAQEHGVVLEVDHRIPRAKGGSDDPANLWTLCFDCNRGKRDSDL
jgi:5-methylcytosine-specific restriction endonuclease McrA